MFVVKYWVTGFGDRVAGPYTTRREADEHCDDVAGFVGVFDARVEPIEEPERDPSI